MKKFLITLLIATFLLIAYASKPDDRTCIIATAKQVWGNVVPDPNIYPSYYNQFMDVTSQSIKIDDWVFLKQIKYKTQNGFKLIGYGAFKRVIPVP